MEEWQQQQQQQKMQKCFLCGGGVISKFVVKKLRVHIITEAIHQISPQTP